MDKIIRENRTWIVAKSGRTIENGKSISHNSSFVKFELPKSLENYEENASWFYLNYLDSYSCLLSNSHNAADIDPKVLEAIPYKEIDCYGNCAIAANYKLNFWFSKFYQESFTKIQK